MAIAERRERVDPLVEEPDPLHVRRAFGLDLHSTYEIPGLAPADGADPVRRTSCSREPADELDRDWLDGGAETSRELRLPDGRLFMSIRRHPRLGYRIWAPRHGRHVVSADGTRIRSALPRRASLGWQRLFFAQPLPLAAALQGLEVLHASAVGIDGRAIAFTAPSGTGKSSLAAHLVAAGATFLTDDVLAVESADGGVLAYPGPARAAVATHEVHLLTPLGRSRLGRRIGATDKPQFEPPLAAAPLPLAIMYRLSRGDGQGRLQFREHVPPEPRLILASCFLPYLRTTERLLNQLSVCAAVTASVRLFDLTIPGSVSAQAAATIALAHAEGVLAE